MTARGVALAAVVLLSCAAVVSAQRGAGQGSASSQGGRTAPPPQPSSQSSTSQQPQAAQAPLFRASVEFVPVDVVVVGPDGEAIQGLTAHDFVLKDRGKVQTVSSFEEVTHTHTGATPGDAAFPPTVRQDVSSNQSARADRLVLLVVDDLHIYQGRTDRARELAKQIITQLGAQASMAVLFTSGQHSTEVTEDRSELLAAAATLKGRQSFRRPNKAIDAQGPGFMDPETNIDTRMKNVDAAQQASLQEFQENMQQYQTLQQAAQMLGADGARRKAFVMLSEGIAKDLSGIFGAMNASVDPPTGGAEYGTTGNIAATMTVSTNHYHDLALVDAMAAMQRASVATYIIDPRGEVKSQDLAIENFPDTTTGLGDGPDTFRWNNPVRQAQDGLGILAQASGGFAVTNTNDFTSGLQKIIEDIDHYYLLGFSPTDASGSGYRRLDVSIPEHPDWTLRFRRGYVPGAPPEPKNSDPLAALSAGVMPKSDVPLRLWATALPPRSTLGPDAKSDTVAISLEVTSPTTVLRDEDGKLRDDLTYELLAVDDHKSKVVSRERESTRFTLGAAASGTPPDSVTYQIPFSVALPPGQYQLRVSAASTKMSAGGSVYLTIDAPDFSSGPLSLSGVALGYADGSHVPVGHPAATAGGGTADASASALPFEPSLSREFASSDTIRIYAEATAKAATVKATLDIVDLQGTVAQSIPAAAGAGLTPGTWEITASAPLTHLAAGAYLARVTMVDDARHTATRDVGFIVK